MSTELIESPANGKSESRSSPLVALGQRYEIAPAKLLDVLRATVIKPDKHGNAATNEEVAAFCIVANHYGLNPFTREIHAFVSGEKGVVPIVGVDGWAKIVNSHERFDGCEFEEEIDNLGKPVSITCVMHVKGRAHPVRVPERFSECKRPTIPWNTMPFRMLRHKAFMQAARYAFGLSGIYDEDEGRDIVRATQQVTEGDTALMTTAEKIRKQLEKPKYAKPSDQPKQPSEPPKESPKSDELGESHGKEGPSEQAKQEADPADSFAIQELRNESERLGISESVASSRFAKNAFADLDAMQAETLLAEMRDLPPGSTPKPPPTDAEKAIVELAGKIKMIKEAIKKKKITEIEIIEKHRVTSLSRLTNEQADYVLHQLLESPK
jgi:phage recombination protein Bet